MMMTARSAETFAIGKYLIQGTVKDEHGFAVEGAALRIGRETAYTDSSGHFLVRFSRRGPFPLRVLPEEFLTNLAYEVVSAPSEVRADSDGAATDIQIVVRTVVHLKPASSSATAPITH